MLLLLLEVRVGHGVAILPIALVTKLLPKRSQVLLLQGLQLDERAGHVHDAVQCAHVSVAAPRLRERLAASRHGAAVRPLARVRALQN